MDLVAVREQDLGRVVVRIPFWFRVEIGNPSTVRPGGHIDFHIRNLAESVPLAEADGCLLLGVVVGVRVAVTDTVLGIPPAHIRIEVDVTDYADQIARTDMFSQALSAASDQFVVLMTERNALVEAHLAAEARVVELEEQLDSLHAVAQHQFTDAVRRLHVAIGRVNAAVQAHEKEQAPRPIRYQFPVYDRTHPPAGQDRPASTERAGISPADRTDPTHRPNSGNCEVSPSSQREMPA